MEHPLREVPIEYAITHDIQLIEHSQPKRKQILMPDGLKIQGQNILRHVLGPDCDIKNYKLYRHAFATRISKLAIQRVDLKQQMDVQTLLKSAFIIVVPYDSTSLITKSEAREDPTLLQEKQCAQQTVEVTTSKKNGTSGAKPDQAVTLPQKQAELNENTVIVDKCPPPIHEENISVHQFLALLKQASSTCSSLDPSQHCSTRGRCSLCNNKSVPVVNVGCNCSLCISCALFRVHMADRMHHACNCRKNTLPFSQWTGVSDDMKQSIRQFAKKVQTDPYVHSPYNDFVDILTH